MLSFSGKPNRGSMIITPAYQEREVPVLSASHSPSNVNADNQQNVESKASTLLNFSSTSEEVQQEDRGDFSFGNFYHLIFSYKKRKKVYG